MGPRPRDKFHSLSSGHIVWHARPMGRAPPLPSSRAPRSRRSSARGSRRLPRSPPCEGGAASGTDARDLSVSSPRGAPRPPRPRRSPRGTLPAVWPTSVPPTPDLSRAASGSRDRGCPWSRCPCATPGIPASSSIAAPPRSHSQENPVSGRPKKPSRLASLGLRPSLAPARRYAAGLARDRRETGPASRDVGPGRVSYPLLVGGVGPEVVLPPPVARQVRGRLGNLASMGVVAPSSPRHSRDQALLSHDAVGGPPADAPFRLATCVGPRRDAPVAIGAAETLLGMHLARR